jgi:GNAT superfamily N-acetyltransferase
MPNPATVRPRRKAPTARVRLPDGARISIRSIRPEDAEAFRHAHTRLSEHSRQRRYLSLASQLRPTDVRYLTAVDHHEHVALVALDPSAREILGSARYIRLPARPNVAEMAIEVIDEWQCRGVGRALLERLRRHAQDAGVVRFVAIVSMENLPVQRILARARASAENVDGELEYTVHVEALAAPDQRRPTSFAHPPERQTLATLLAEPAAAALSATRAVVRPKIRHLPHGSARAYA